MRVRVLSDLHLEFEGRLAVGEHAGLRYRQGDLPRVPADLTILAGDIAIGADGVRWAQETFVEPVVYVAGNHEFYGRQWQETLAELRDAAAGTHVHFLEDDEVRIATADGEVRVLGAALWTDFAIGGERTIDTTMFIAERAMTDYQVIRFADAGAPAGERRLRPDDARQAHAVSRAFLERALGDAALHHGRTVVVTHMLPSAQSLSGRWAGSPLNGAFASDLEPLLRMHRPALWVHGHTHESADYRVGRTRVVCNPRGYVPKDTNPAFDPTLIVEI